MTDDYKSVTFDVRKEWYRDDDTQPAAGAQLLDEPIMREWCDVEEPVTRVED